MKIIPFQDPRFEQNSYVLETKNALLVIDPGMNGLEILSYLQTKERNITAVLLTHGHFDHIRDIRLLSNHYTFPVYLHSSELDLVNLPDFNFATAFQDSFVFKKTQEIIPFDDREQLSFEDINVKVFHSPGHTRGSSCFCVGNHLFTGDTLFAEGYGRTDLLTGSMKDLRISLLKIRESFSSSVMIYPGHNDSKKLKDIVMMLP